MALTDKLTAIANAIRAKTGKTGTLTLDQMPTEIAGITGGGGGSSADVRYVTFRNESTGEEYKKPVAYGDDCVDVVAKGLWKTPTQESTAQYNYTFYGWGAEPGGAADANILKNITEDKTVYAIFTATLRTYTITWLDDDGTTVLKTEQVAYNDIPSYAPKKDGMGIEKWTPTPVAATADASYTATWAAELDFSSMTWSEINDAVQAGKAKLFTLGATKTYTGRYDYECIAQIVGIEQDDLADGSGKAGLTIATAKVSGEATTKWSNSATYSIEWLNSTAQTATIFAKSMEQSSFELKDIAKLVKKTHYAADGTYKSNDVQYFLPSRREITGAGYEEGTQYQYYSAGWVGKLLVDTMWTRSKQSYTTGKVYYVSNTSAIDSSTGGQEVSTNKKYAISYFCI